MSQTDKLYELLKDGKPHSTIEIRRVVYGDEHLSMARIASRANDLRKRGYVIESRPGKINKTIWWYKLTPKEPQPKETPQYRPVLINKRVYHVLESDLPKVLSNGGQALPDY